MQTRLGAVLTPRKRSRVARALVLAGMAITVLLTRIASAQGTPPAGAAPADKPRDTLAPRLEQSGDDWMAARQYPWAANAYERAYELAPTGALARKLADAREAAAGSNHGPARATPGVSRSAAAIPPRAAPRRSEPGPVDAAPAGHHFADTPRYGLVAAGAVTLLVPYLGGVFAAIGSNESNQSGWLFAPVVGPWVALGQRHPSSSPCNSTSSCFDYTNPLAVIGLVVDGALQAIGVTLFAIGYLAPRRTLVPDAGLLRLLPTRVGSGYGLGLGSTF